MSGGAAGAPIRTVLIGATGRMGGEILRQLPQYPGLRLSGALASAGSAAIGRDAAEHAGAAPIGVSISAALEPLLPNADLVIDFSSAQAVAAHLAACLAARVPLLLGTTGLSPELQAMLTSAATTIPVLVAPNTSVAVTLLLELVALAARALPRSYDIEVQETHHRGKRDAPSGTALALGQAAARARGLDIEQAGVHARHGPQPVRTSDQIGFAVLRGGDVVGEHEVLFLGPGERLALRHVATDRAVFARGALQAGQWLASQAPGRYQMKDIFK